MNSATTPEQRLALSRQALRLALQPRATADAAPQGATGAPTDAAAATPWVDIPGATTLFQWLRDSWQLHPARSAYKAGVEAGNAVLHPVAQRHPLALVAGALAIGAFLAWAVPWRRALRPTTLVAWLMPVIIGAIKPLASSPWTAVVSAWLRAQERNGTQANAPVKPEKAPAAAGTGSS